jgi:hypothetical protein
MLHFRAGCREETCHPFPQLTDIRNPGLRLGCGGILENSQRLVAGAVTLVQAKIRDVTQQGSFLRARLVAVTAIGVVLWLTVNVPGEARQERFERWQSTERWVIQSGRIAPWAPPGFVASPTLRGQALRFDGNRVAGPAPLGCSNVLSEFVVSPAEGLFEGSLPAPANLSARNLGIMSLPILTWRVRCDTGSFDYHLTDNGRAMLGLDNQIWTLTRQQRSESPEAAVLDFLRTHMTQEMAFQKASVAQKRAMITDALQREINAYFARPFPKDEPPPINGDPFTNSQEYPTSFVLGKAVIQGASAEVATRFSDGVRTRVVVFRMQRGGSSWRLDDLKYEDGSTFRQLLRT